MAVTINLNPEPTDYIRLFRAAGAEVGIEYPINPDFDTYSQLIDDGMYMFIGAEDDGIPVGYIGILLSPSLFNREYINAIVDSFYVKEHLRRGSVPGRLLSTAVANIKCHSLVFTCKETSQLAKTLLRRGFEKIESNYERIFSNGKNH